MSYAFNQSWDMLSKSDEDSPFRGLRRKRRVVVPRMKLREKIDEPKKITFTDDYKNLMRNLTNQSATRPYTNDDDEARTRSMLEFLQTATGNNNTQISAGGNVNTNPPQEQSAMDLAMEEIRAAQAQREAHAKQFQEMMSGSFANAFPQNISEEMADMIAAFKLQGMSNEQATKLTRQNIGE